MDEITGTLGLTPSRAFANKDVLKKIRTKHNRFGIVPSSGHWKECKIFLLPYLKLLRLHDLPLRHI